MRQALIPESPASPAGRRFGRYFFYAVGEIVLVVIGILIALQVNNWNEIQKQEKKEHVYLKKLASNLEDDILLLQSIIHSDSLMVKSLQKISKDIFTLSNPNQLNFSDNSRFKVNLFYPNKTMFDNLISSGQIEVMDNEEIVEKLQLYYRSIIIAREGIDNSLKNYSRDIENFFVHFDHRLNGPLLPKKTIEDYRNEPFILNSFYYKTGLLHFQINNYKNLIGEAEILFEMINKEIKQ